MKEVSARGLEWVSEIYRGSEGGRELDKYGGIEGEMK